MGSCDDMGQRPDNQRNRDFSPANEDWVGAEFHGRFLHAEARDLLALVGRPELIEAKFSDRASFEELMSSSGYRREVDSANVTVGWGRRAGRDYTSDPTTALIRFKEEPDAVYQLGLGGKGAYALEEIFREGGNVDLAKPLVTFVVQKFGSAVSESTREYIDEKLGISIDQIRQEEAERRRPS